MSFLGSLKNKENKNIFWIIAGKLAQMLIAFAINIWTTRFLGPSNSGLINYVSAYVAFFTSFCTLGFTAVVMVNELTKNPDEEGQTLGTSFVLRLISSTLSAITIVCIVMIVDHDEPETILIAILSSVALLFQVFDSIEYWFQKRYLSKITSIAVFIGYCFTSAYRIVLLVLEANVYWFAFASSIDYIIVAIVLLIVYKKNGGPKFKFSWQKGKQLLKVGSSFILSGMMVAIYGQTDKIMLKLMLSETEVGYYSTAASLCVMWTFVLSAIVSSLSPTITAFKKEGNEEKYLKKNRQLYCMVFYISIFVSIIIAIAAPLIVTILYGAEFEGSIVPLRIVTWYVAFSYLGVARDIWLVCENKQKYSKYIYLLAAICNVCLNFIFIPSMGPSGAALASLITQILTSILLPCLFRGLRPNVKLILMGISFYDFRHRNKLPMNEEN